jgi:ABC-type bacteriocin/lantibiotic exporter with double-glycine peptidase domain
MISGIQHGRKRCEPRPPWRKTARVFFAVISMAGLAVCAPLSAETVSTVTVTNSPPGLGCGTDCVALVCLLLKGNYAPALDELRDEIPLTAKGTSLLQLQEFLTGEGFMVSAVRDIQPPIVLKHRQYAIAHLDSAHFVVLFAKPDGQIGVVDPPNFVEYEDIAKHLTGNYLLVSARVADLASAPQFRSPKMGDSFWDSMKTRPKRLQKALFFLLSGVGVVLLIMGCVGRRGRKMKGR